MSPHKSDVVRAITILALALANAMNSPSALAGAEASTEGVKEASEPPASRIPVAFEIESIPLIEVRPEPAYGVAPAAELPASERSAGQATNWGLGPQVRWAPNTGPAGISVVITKNLDFSHSSQAQSWLRFYQKNPEAPALTASCFRGADRDRAVESFTLGLGRDGTYHYIHTHAWVNFATCKGLLLRHEDAPVKPIAGGLVLAYRTRCPSCKDASKETLHLVMPSVDSGQLTAPSGDFTYWTRIMSHVEVPIGQGVATTFTASFSREAIERWNRVTPAPLPLEPTNLRIEISHGAGERSPTALTWAYRNPRGF